ASSTSPRRRRPTRRSCAPSASTSCVARAGRASSWRSRSVATWRRRWSSPGSCMRSSARMRCFASTTTSARRPCRTSPCCALRPISDREVGARTVRGQYGRGYIEGRAVPAYREEKGVAADSQTESFVALRCFIDNWRWEGVPFYIRTGKRLPKRATEIAIRFRIAPHRIFTKDASEGLEANELVLRIQPDEGISLTFGAKVPVQGLRIRTVNIDFVYGASIMVDAPDAYE